MLQSFSMVMFLQRKYRRLWHIVRWVDSFWGGLVVGNACACLRFHWFGLCHVHDVVVWATSFPPPPCSVRALSLDFYLTAAHVSTGVSMGAEAETLILCRVAMDRPLESYGLIAACLSEIFNIRPGESLDNITCFVIYIYIARLLYTSPGVFRSW